MTAIARPAGNTAGHTWSIGVTMTSVLAALMLSSAALADPGPAVDPAPGAAAPPPAQAPAADPQASVPAPPAAAPQILPPDQRLEAHDQFRALYDTGRFQEALPLAQRVVELSEADSDRDFELPIAYNNLGATQFQLNDYQAAEASYKKSLELLEETQGISSRRLIVPLVGLGAVYAALDEHALAVAQFDRALAVSRRSEGLFNLKQLPLIEQAANSRFALTDYVGVERDRLYALRIAEQNYGFDDPRTLPAVMQLAHFYESLAEFAAARGLYLRIRDISMKESGGFNPVAIRSMIAIARTHRLQYAIDPESLEDDAAVRDPITGEVLNRGYQTSHAAGPTADRAGLKSVEQALELLRATPDPPPQLLAEALTELGDWYQATSRPGTATPYYAEAATIYTADVKSGRVNPLLAPRMVFYRAPVGAKRSVGVATAKPVVHKTVFSFTVTESGKPGDISVVTSDMSESQLSQSRRALERAIYSPRFENGKPVSTEGVQFTGEWYEHPPPEVPSASGS